MATTQVAEKLQPWMAVLESAAAGWTPLDAGPSRSRGARFAALGFPTVRDEEWRFTNVAPIARTEFTVAPPRAGQRREVDALPYGSLPLRLVVLNGRFSAELSRLIGLPSGVRAGSLAAAATEHAEVVPRYFGQLADFSTRGFVALNTALASRRCLRLHP